MGGMTRAPSPEPFLVADRTGPSTYLGRNERGAQVRIGPEGDDGVFSPGELLAIAVAACAGMSADSRISWELGDDVPIAVTVRRTKVEGENRYGNLAVDLAVGTGHQDAARRERMLATSRTAIDKHCTVSRTVTAGCAVEFTLHGDGEEA